MTTAHDIERSLYDWAPRELAMAWDNVGLLVGDPAQEVRRVLVALDITQGVAEEAVSLGAQMIVSHHPVMNCARGTRCRRSARTTRREGFCAISCGTASRRAVCTPIWTRRTAA